MSEIRREDDIKKEHINPDETLAEIEEVLRVTFSESQKASIMHFGKPLNILSCAGSGKTTTVIAKMLFMEMFYGVPASKILAITFNKEAIVQMENRYFKARRKLGMTRSQKITFRTYHSLYYLILNSKHTKYSWDKLGEYTTYLFKLQKACRDHFKKTDDDTLTKVMAIRGYQINNQLSDEELMKTPEFLTSGIDPKGYKKVIQKYNELKDLDNMIDFDDLQLMMYEAVQENPELLNIIHQAWDFIVVDEYQDISKIQLDILKGMVKDPNKLTAIGDDDQSIYEFRGSKTEYIIDFHVHFPGADRIIMDTNYRVPENILVPVTYSINHNKHRVNKDMKAAQKDGELRYSMTKGMMDTALSVVEDIKREMEKGRDLKDIILLIRNNRQQMIVLDALLEADIPVSSSSHYRASTHFITKDIMTIIELALDETNTTAFKKVFTKIAKYTKKAWVKEAADKMTERGGSWREYMLDLNKPEIHDASSMLYGVKKMIEEEKPFSNIVASIQELYREYMKFMMDRFDYDADEMGDILNYLKHVGEHKTYEKFMKDNKQKEALMRYYKDQPDETVKISTMHKMKGLEYPVVYLIDLTESVLPDAGIENRVKEEYGDEWAMDYIEQERRLFYVAWTRAQEVLNVYVNQYVPSRFIIETIQGGGSPS